MFMKNIKVFKTHVWTIRHAPTPLNRYQGTRDKSIVPHKVNEYFQRLKVKRIPQPDVIIVSDLIRTRQTAEALKQYLKWPKIPFFTNKDLSERRLGIMEIKTHDEVKELMIKGIITVPLPPEYIEKLENLSEILETPHFKFVGIESMDEVRIRIEKALFETAALYPNKNLLLVSHYAVLKSQGLDQRKIGHLVVSRDTQGIFHKKIIKLLL